MKLGLMSDIHGNEVALRSVLDDAATVGVDQWWVLGDIVAFGPNPVEVLELIGALTNVTCIFGNTERYVVTGERPFPTFADTLGNPDLLPRLVEVAVSLAWTRGAVTQAGWFPWLSGLAGDVCMALPDGTRVLGVHASPRSADGAGIDTKITDTDLAALLHNCYADIVFAGHTHDLTDRTISGVRAVNLGSVSNPSRPDGAATYAVLHIEPDHHTVEHRIVHYDHSAAASAVDAAAHPAGDYIKRFHARHAQFQ